MCGMDGKLNDVNPAYAAIIGRSVEETKRMSYWDITPEEFSNYEDEKLENLDRNGFYGPYEKEYFHKDGRRIPVSLRGKVVCLDGVEYILSSVEDISDKKECYESLKRAIKDATDANLAKSAFLSSMSHELRTPLNAIIGFSQLLEMGGDKLSKDQLVSVNEIQRGGKHLLALINEILDLSKIESGKVSVNMQSISLTRIIEECLRLTSSQAEDNNVAIVVAKNTDFTMNCDPLRLKQIVLNYLSNAIKYNTQSGTVSITFKEITHDITGKKYLRIIVSDTGNGLSEKQMASLFTPFERVGAEKGTVQGTGIGLAISKKLATLMDGGVGVSSTLGEGSDFWVDVLLAGTFIQENMPKENKDSVNIQISTPSVIDQAVGAANVLYIDDNEGNILFMKHAFKLYRDSYSLQACSNPHQGLALAIENPPDLILLDISMPGMDGFEVLKHLEKDKATCEVPVIAVSANAMDVDIEKGMSAGFNGYLCKPFNFSTLMNKIDDTLNN